MRNYFKRNENENTSQNVLATAEAEHRGNL